MAAVINNGGGFYSTFAYVSEARRMGVEILPPDVNISLAGWYGKEKKIRVGLRAVKGLSSQTIGKIVGARQDGLFLSVEQFLQRVEPGMLTRRKR